MIESGTFKQVQETYTHLVEQLRPVMEVGQAAAKRVQFCLLKGPHVVCVLATATDLSSA